MAGNAVVTHVVAFGRVLREAGLEVGPGRLADALTGLDHVDVTLRDDVYWTLRQTLVSREEDLDAFDRAFRAWFLRAPVLPPARRREERLRVVRDAAAEPGSGEAGGGETPSKAGYSADENPRTKDPPELTPHEVDPGRPLIAGPAA